MAENGFPFLSLPVEVRYIIYAELLIPSPDKPLLLWHDREGREQSISIYPQILQASKQVNAEATPLLYERNKFSLSLTTREDHSCHARKINKSQALIRDETAKPARHFDQPGLLFPSCFQRLAHIEIIISVQAVWAQGPAGNFWSGTGDLFMQLLQLLADEEVTEAVPRRKTLSIKVRNQLSSSGHGWLLFPRLPIDSGFIKMPLRCGDRDAKGEKQMADQICPLVQAISEKRTVCIHEVLKRRLCTFTPAGQRSFRNIIREISVAEFEDL